MMIRGVFVATLVLSLSLAVRAAAVAPHQADLDACNKEAAAAGAPSASLDERAVASAPQRQADASTDGSASAVQSTPSRDPGAAERQAFAACLARHGYYKGFYRSGDQPHS